MKSEIRSKIHSAAYGKAKMQKLPANMAAASLSVTLPNSRQQQAMKKISAASLLVIDFPVIVPELNFRARNGFRAGDIGFGQRDFGVNQLVTHRSIQ